MQDEAARSEAALPSRVADLFEQHSSPVFRSAYRITGSAEDAEDVLQHVFLNLLQSASTSAWPVEPARYVQRAAANASLDLLRRRRRWRLQRLDDQLAPPLGNVEHVAASRLDEVRLVARLRSCLAEIPPLEAEVLVLHAFEGLGNTEIATLLGKTPNYVGVLLHAARVRLRDLLHRDDTPPALDRRTRGPGDTP